MSTGRPEEGNRSANRKRRALVQISDKPEGKGSRSPVRGPALLPLTVLAGLDRHAVGDIATGLLLRVPRLALVWADPFTAELGYIQTRVSDSDGRCTERTVDLEHGCLSCAMRAGVIAAVRGLASTGRYDAVLIHLHPGIEADAAIAALDAGLAGTAFVDTVGTVLAEPWLDLLAGDASTAECGIAVAPDDDRSTATILAADLEIATVLIALGPAANPTFDENAALSVLAPDVVRVAPATALDIDPVEVLHTGRYDRRAADRFARRGLLDPQLVLPNPSDGLQLVRWASRRPLHPGRLHTALDRLADGVIRSSGYLWFATRPELIVGWDSAGDCLNLGPHGIWLTPPPGRAAVTHSAWESSAAQRAHAARAAHPYYGDRANLLAFLGDDLDAESIRAALSGCELTDDELATGVEGWQSLEDPFPDWSDAFCIDASDDARADDEQGAA